MPIPEPGLYRPSNLTKQQKQEQLAACYGVNMREISAAEAEQMRSILQRYDSEHKPITIHNLNDPPKVPYRYQKFPMMVYNHEQSQPAHEEIRSGIVGSSVIEETVHIKAKVVSMLVHSEDALQLALREGWRTDAPEFRDEPDQELSAANQIEADRAERSLRSGRKARA